ncbi:hypothetical protein [Colwellia echini]|uniref:Uncharacterized protein n=1 Tax=Colwellia echini TaxID=1982103 RepID=A0ABY3MUP2_9GAMM|nr:hypothetical protein [Colwellia echini]TYK64904.1 hypothetical protein CWS31_013130 [Colwellia echini]
MRLLSYLYQLKISFINLLYSKTSLAAHYLKVDHLKVEHLKTDHVKAEPEQELQIELPHNLKLKCEIAAQKREFINNFSHWPITKAKKNIDPKDITTPTLGQDDKLPLNNPTKHTLTKNVV